MLTTVAMLIFVKKDLTRPRNPLDTLSVLLSFALCFLAIPFITVATCLLQLAMDNGALLYQIFLCVPGLTAFTVARRGPSSTTVTVASEKRPKTSSKRFFLWLQVS